jgi:hypothetical protein
MSDAPPPPTGSSEDMIRRQASILPPWFGPPGTTPPILGIPMAMAADVAAWAYEFIMYVRQQSRIKTATGGWLDMIAWDFFGSRLRRRLGQTDESFRRRILIEMFRPRNTRPAMIAVLKDLTGHAPRIFEPARPQDTGGIGTGGGMGIGVSGSIGSVGQPGEVFIDVYRTPEAGIAYAAGIGIPVGGIGVASRLTIADLAQVRGVLTDDDIRAAVVATRAEGVRVWMRILSSPRAA